MMRSKVVSASIGLFCISLLSLPLMANADTYTVFGISGTDSQRSSDLSLGDPGCYQPICASYVPGTFSGTALVDLSTDTITAAIVSTFGGAASYYTETFNTSFASTPNLGSGLNLVISSAPIPEVPVLYFDFNLASNTVSGEVSGYSGGSGESEAGASYTMNMVGTLKPERTTTIPPTAAPEIDPASAASSLTMLVGGLLVFRGRRARRLAA